MNSRFRPIRSVDPQGKDALSLLREAAIEARALYPEFHEEGAPWPSNAPTPTGGIYLVAYDAESPVGCGALRPIDEKTVEVRRMYVLKSARRSGLAKEILALLESQAAQMGYAVMRLETGNRQQPAMALYESCGFQRIPSFGEYAIDPTSVCYEKHLVEQTDA